MTLTDDEQKLVENPLTAADLNAMSRSAHAWWKWTLNPDCHPDAGLTLTVHGCNGHEPTAQLRTACRECGQLCGVIAVK